MLLVLLPQMLATSLADVARYVAVLVNVAAVNPSLFTPRATEATVVLIVHSRIPLHSLPISQPWHQDGYSVPVNQSVTFKTPDPSQYGQSVPFTLWLLSSGSIVAQFRAAIRACQEGV
jgi:hypothetical protein